MEVDCSCAVNISYVEALWRRLFGEQSRNHRATVEQICKRIKADEQLANSVFVMLFNCSSKYSPVRNSVAENIKSALTRNDIDAMLVEMDNSHQNQTIDVLALEASNEALKDAKANSLARLKAATKGSDERDLFDAMVEARKLCLTNEADFSAAVSKLRDMKQSIVGKLAVAGDMCELMESKGNAETFCLADTPEFASATKTLANLQQKDTESLRAVIGEQSMEKLMSVLNKANSSRINDSPEYCAAVEALKKAKKALESRLATGDFNELKSAIEEADRVGLGEGQACTEAKVRVQGMKDEALALLSAAIESNSVSDLVGSIEHARSRDLNEAQEMQAACEALDALKKRLLSSLQAAAADDEIDKLMTAIADSKAAGLETTPEYVEATAALEAKKRKAIVELEGATESEDPVELMNAIAKAEKLGLRKSTEFEAAEDLLDSLKERSLACLQEAVGYKDADLLLAALVDAKKLGLSDTPAFKAALLMVEDLQQGALKELSEATPWDIAALKRALKLAKKLGLEDASEYNAASDMLESAKGKALAALASATAAGDVNDLIAAMKRAESLDLQVSSEYSQAAAKLQSIRDAAKADLNDAILSGKIESLLRAIEQAQQAGLDKSEYSDALDALEKARVKTKESLKNASLIEDIEKLAAILDDAQKLGLSDTSEFKVASDVLKAARDAAADKLAAEKAAAEEKAAKEKAAAEAKARLEKLKKLFDACDKPSKGCMSQAGLLTGFSEQQELKIGLGFPSVTTLEFFEDLFHAAKSENESVVTFEQFENFYQKMLGGIESMPLSWEEVDQILRTFFEACDKDGSGAISKSEFLNGLWDADAAQTVFNFPKTIDASEVDKLWKIMDADGSGEISYDELYQYYALYWRTHAKLKTRPIENPTFSQVLESMVSREFQFGPAHVAHRADDDDNFDLYGDDDEDDNVPDPAVALVKSWSVTSRNVYNDNLQKFDENLLKSERALGNLKKLKGNGIKVKSNMNELFDALPKIADAIDTLNRGVGGNHDFLTAAFQHSDRLDRLKAVLFGSHEGSEEFCVSTLMKKDDVAQSGMHTKAFSRLTKSYHAVTKVSLDTRGSRASLSVRSVEESGINFEENKVVATLMRRSSSKALEG